MSEAQPKPLALLKPEQNVIRELRRLLAVAESGELRGFVAVADYGSSTATTQQGDFCYPMLIGQLRALEFGMLLAWRGEPEE